MKKNILILLGIIFVVALAGIVYHFILKKQSTIEANDRTTELGTAVITYQILNITGSNDENYLYLTIRKYQVEEVETVKVNRKLAKDVKADRNYEFAFQYPIGAVEDNIKSIFQNAELISIIETDKKGMEQRQDSFQ